MCSDCLPTSFDVSTILHGYVDDWWAIDQGNAASEMCLKVSSAVSPLITKWAPADGQRFNVAKSCAKAFSKHVVDPSEVTVRFGNNILRVDPTPEVFGPYPRPCSDICSAHREAVRICSSVAKHCTSFARHALGNQNRQYNNLVLCFCHIDFRVGVSRTGQR